MTALYMHKSLMVHSKKRSYIIISYNLFYPYSIDLLLKILYSVLTVGEVQLPVPLPKHSDHYWVHCATPFGRALQTAQSSILLKIIFDNQGYKYNSLTLNMMRLTYSCGRLTIGDINRAALISEDTKRISSGNTTSFSSSMICCASTTGSDTKTAFL
jgi:hypothetical protein